MGVKKGCCEAAGLLSTRVLTKYFFLDGQIRLQIKFKNIMSWQLIFQIQILIYLSLHFYYSIRRINENTNNQTQNSQFRLVKEFRKLAWNGFPCCQKITESTEPDIPLSKYLIKLKYDAQLLCIQYSYLCYFNNRFNFCSITLNLQISIPTVELLYNIAAFWLFLVIRYSYFIRLDMYS